MEQTTLLTPIEARSPWESKQIELYGVKLAALVLGDIAVHRSINVEGKWAVSALPSRMFLLRVDTLDDALRIGMIVRSKMLLSLRKLDSEALRAEVPPWLLAWGKKCKAESRYVDYQPYESGEVM